MGHAGRAALIVPILFGLGCAARGPRFPVLEPGPAGVEALLDTLRAAGCPPDLKSDLDLFLESRGERPARMEGALRVAWPDRVRLQARAGVFFPVASIVVRADSTFLHLPRAKAYWCGETASSAGNAPGSLAAGILWLLCPGPRLAALQDPILDRSSAAWRLRGRLGGEPPLWLTAVFDKDRLEVREMLVQDEQGRAWMRAVGKGRQTISGSPLPRSVRIEIADPPAVLEVRILRPRKDTATDPGVFRLARPKGTRWVDPDALLPSLGSRQQVP
jgi:hypothetical protein